MEFPLSTFCVLKSTLPVSTSLLYITLVACWCVSFDNRHRIVCLLPSLTTVYYYFVLILRVTATVDLSDDGMLVVGEYTVIMSSSPNRRVWASLIYQLITRMVRTSTKPGLGRPTSPSTSGNVRSTTSATGPHVPTTHLRMRTPPYGNRACTVSERDRALTNIETASYKIVI